MSAGGQGGPLLRWVYRAYQGLLSPMLHAISPTQCKFLPTCSEYAYVAIARHGVVRGSALALRRLARCHPMAAGGFDPVPGREERSRQPPGGEEPGRPGGASKGHQLSS